LFINKTQNLKSCFLKKCIENKMLFNTFRYKLKQYGKYS
jgi:hypothetical protein